MLFTPERISIEVCGKSYTVIEPSRREARRLMAGVARLAPKMSSLYDAMRKAGARDGSEASMMKAATRLSGDAAAQMLEMYDPLCDWLHDAVPEIPQADIDNATEADLVRAWKQIKDLVEVPLSRNADGSRPKTPKPSGGIQRSSTSARKPKRTKTGKAARTKSV